MDRHKDRIRLLLREEGERKIWKNAPPSSGAFFCVEKERRLEMMKNAFVILSTLIGYHLPGGNGWTNFEGCVNDL